MKSQRIPVRNFATFRVALASIFLFSVLQSWWLQSTFFNQGNVFLTLITAICAVFFLAGAFTNITAVLCLVFHCLFTFQYPETLHLGDKYLMYMLFLAVCVPWKQVHFNSQDFLDGPFALAIKVQCLLIYASNLFLKIQSGWLADAGLKSALLETELQTPVSKFLLAHESLILPLNTLTLGISVLIILLLLTRYSTGALYLGVLYHLFSYALFKLDWLPLASIIPMLLFIPVSGLKNRLVYPSRHHLVYIALLAVTLVGAFFQKYQPNQMFSQLWMAYSPPSEYGGQFLTTVTYRDYRTEDFINAEALGRNSEYSNLRDYKLFHTMAKAGTKELRLSYANFLCATFKSQAPLSVRLQYQGRQTRGALEDIHWNLGTYRCQDD